MNNSKLSFASTNLVVDWISFKFEKLDETRKDQITNYLFQLGFNSYQQSGRLVKPIKEGIQVNLNNKLEVIFIKERPYWKGTTVNFSGKNAFVFYIFIQKNIIDWEIFSSGVLSRFDLYYNRQIRKSDKYSVTTFLENCHNEVSKTIRASSLEKNKKGQILKIGNRRSNRYHRIYETEKSIKFETEMKGQLIQNYHELLISNQLDQLEEKLSSNFLVSFGKLLPLNYSYSDWLLLRLRPIRKQSTLSLGLKSDYVRSEIIADPKNFICLLQFLKYAVDLDFKIEYFGGIAYREVIFSLRDFLKFQNPTIDITNKYQLRKLKNFFNRLQKGCLITTFTDSYFQSLVAIPRVTYEICPKQKCWIVKVCLIEELFAYNYPFYLPNLFQNKLTNLQIKVRVRFIQVFTSVILLQKEFLIPEFFQSYGSALSNQNKTKIKKEFIQMVGLFRKLKLIEDTYEVISDNSYFFVEKLTTDNISEGFRIREKLEI